MHYEDTGITSLKLRALTTLRALILIQKLIYCFAGNFGRSLRNVSMTRSTIEPRRIFSGTFNLKLNLKGEFGNFTVMGLKA